MKNLTKLLQLTTDDDVSVISKDDIDRSTDITYADLLAKYQAGTMSPGCYKITNYRSYMPKYNHADITIPANMHEGTIEPLYVLAMSPTHLHPIAVSSLFPHEIIYYEIVDKTLYSSDMTWGGDRGRISRRINQIYDIDCHFDFRNMVTTWWEQVLTNFTGTGINDLDSIGIFTGETPTTYTVEIDGTNTFRWNDGGSWVAEGVGITLEAQELNNGVAIVFHSPEYTIGDTWTFTRGLFGVNSDNSLGHRDFPFFGLPILDAEGYNNYGHIHFATNNSLFTAYAFLQTAHKVYAEGGFESSVFYGNVSDVHLGGCGNCCNINGDIYDLLICGRAGLTITAPIEGLYLMGETSNLTINAPIYKCSMSHGVYNMIITEEQRNSHLSGLINTFRLTLDITGLTELNLSKTILQANNTSDLRDWAGHIYLTSTNATETINSIIIRSFADYGVGHRRRLIPLAGLTLTISAGTFAGQGVDIVINGTTNEWVEFDPAGITGGIIYSGTNKLS